MALHEAMMKFKEFEFCLVMVVAEFASFNMLRKSRREEKNTKEKPSFAIFFWLV